MKSPNWCHLLCACVVVAALSPCASGAVVYTPMNIEENSFGVFFVDLNGDSRDEFVFDILGSAVSLTSFGAGHSFVFTPELAGPANLPAGSLIGSASNWSTSTSVFALQFDQGTWRRPFGGASNGVPGFIGFRIDGDGHFNYGYIAATLTGVGAGDSVSLKISQFAYESDPDTPITISSGVPEPSTFALLAVGAAGLLALRKRRKV